MATLKPFQFDLRSLFLATAAVGMALGVFKWLGPITMILAVQFAAVVAVLVKSKGTAWPGMVFPGMFVAIVVSFAPFSHVRGSTAPASSLRDLHPAGRPE